MSRQIKFDVVGFDAVLEVIETTKVVVRTICHDTDSVKFEACWLSCLGFLSANGKGEEA